MRAELKQTSKESTAQKAIAIEDYHIINEPFYLPAGDENNIFEVAYSLKLPIMLKGPTGCGKTRFLEYMAWKLSLPLVTVACHEDLTASDLVGRYLLKGEQTIWSDGPLTDDRRILPQEKRSLLLEAHPNFVLVISYNPGYQSVMKDLKHSTRQRFVALEFTHPSADNERIIIMKETGVNEDMADRLVRIGEMVRNLRQHGLEEGVSTRLLVYAARLISRGISPPKACEVAVIRSMTDDREMQEAIAEIVSGIF